MAVLLEIFDEQREHLSQQIRGDSDPEKVARRIRNFLDSLPREYEKRQAPTLNEKRRLGFITDLLKEASSLLAVHNAELYRPYRRVARPAGQSSFVLKRLAQLVLLILLFGGLLAIGAFSALLLLLLLVAVTLPAQVISQPDKWTSYLSPQKSETDQKGPVQNDKNDVQAVARVDSIALLNKLREMIRAAEDVFEDKGHEPPPPPDNPIHEARELLDFFQDLLEAEQFQDAEFALKRLRSLKRLLNSQDIELEDFKEGQNAHYFNFLSGERSGRETQRLALVSKDGRLLLRGTVVEPAEKT